MSRRHPRDTGAVSFVRAGPHGIHRLGHDGEPGAAPAISLHVYGVAGEQIATHINDLVRVAAPASA
ncbi:cysteine dioxygenase [Burkholderia pyrrocinia]|uniref:Cysteine dioxygenase n=1 Tax=Burkholderia pyrrocinia TaxID=60550 RepID=A0A2Z5MTY2_BURPY|nr:cysteine dioxygenase [Burkholderia pyrrocinia]AXF20138.1 cysteine dioxygenase [Burkholderia pyrrocinia]